MLAPNKQNLLLLKKQEKAIKSGYRLLKEKRTGLIVAFMDRSKQGKALEKEVGLELKAVLQKYATQTAFTSISSLISSFEPQPVMSVKSFRKKVSGVYVYDLKVAINPPKRKNLKPSLQESLNNFASLFPKILILTQLKMTCKSLAEEILKTNRQISTIEKRIQKTQADIKYISQTLNEKSNFEKATLIKIFN